MKENHICGSPDAMCDTECMELAYTRRYEFDVAGVIHEDELPDDMTEADYTEWFRLSYVDFVRVGPMPVAKCEPT